MGGGSAQLGCSRVWRRVFARWTCRRAVVTLLVVNEDPPDVATRLRAALGVSDGNTPAHQLLHQMRAAEDAVLATWSDAVTGYADALARRRKIIGRAEARVRHHMAPLAPARYKRMEHTLGNDGPYGRSANWVRDMLLVQRTRSTVGAARARLIAVTATQDAALAAARELRSRATGALIDTLGLRCASNVTGLSPERLNKMCASH